MKLREYQRDSIAATHDFLRTRDDNPCIVVPVGGGKSVIMAALIQEAITQFPGTRICVLAHVRELVRQNADKLQKAWPDAPLGIYSASLNRRDRFEPIIFASIQSVYNKAGALGRFDLLLVDEAHRIPIKSEGTYRHFINECRRFNPHIRVIGFTATPFRLQGGYVCSPDYILNAVAYEKPIKELINEGYLNTLISKGGATRADLDGLHVRAGEYIEDEISERMQRGDLVPRACREILELCHNRKSWIIFACSVSHAESIHAELTKLGVDGRVVVGNTPKTERDNALSEFSHGRIRFLVSVDVLGEGYDEPRIDALIMMRPTKSAGKYVQQVGRGTRTRYEPGFDIETTDGRLAAIAASAKPTTLVLDFAGNIEEHGPVDAIKIEPPKQHGGKVVIRAAPTKRCPNEHCCLYVPIQVMTCPDCGHEWPAPLPNHADTASDAPILSDGAVKIATHPVRGISYAKGISAGKPPFLNVTYSCGLRFFYDRVFLESSGAWRAKAVDWWQARNYTRVLQVPRTVDEALEVAHQLRAPKEITVNESGKFPTIVGVNL